MGWFNWCGGGSWCPFSNLCYIADVFSAVSVTVQSNGVIISSIMPLLVVLMRTIVWAVVAVAGYNNACCWRVDYQQDAFTVHQPTAGWLWFSVFLSFPFPTLAGFTLQPPPQITLWSGRDILMTSIDLQLLVICRTRRFRTTMVPSWPGDKALNFWKIKMMTT